MESFSVWEIYQRPNQDEKWEALWLFETEEEAVEYAKRWEEAHRGDLYHVRTEVCIET